MLRRLLALAAVLIVVALVGAGGWMAWQAGYLPVASAPPAHDEDEHDHDHDHDHGDEAPSVELSPQARRNLNLVLRRVEPTTYWKSIDLPGVIVDRPGISDRGVTTPVTGVVTKIHAFPGDMVPPDSPLFTVRLVSESLHASQLELFKATKEIEIARDQHQRLERAAQTGALAGSRLIEIENQIERLQVTVQAYRQDLEARGLPAERIEAAAQGEFVTEIEVRAPGEQALQMTRAVLSGRGQKPHASATHAQAAYEQSESDDPAAPAEIPFSFEMHRLHVELGQQVEAGYLLCTLADHRALMIEGRGFEDDMPHLQEAARLGLEVAVDFEETALPGLWPPLPEKFRIHHVANTVDPESRTFAFYLELENQWRSYERDGETRLLWRFRPGSRVRLRIATEKLDDVYVLPQGAVVRDGPEAYVFRKSGDRFDRRSVHVLYEDRKSVVLANDGQSLRPGYVVAHNGAAAINRALVAQSTQGLPAGMHVHADGSVHGAH